MSHVSLLSDQFCIYISLNCVFLREEAELPARPPPPLPKANCKKTMARFFFAASLNTNVIYYFSEKLENCRSLKNSAFAGDVVFFKSSSLIVNNYQLTVFGYIQNVIREYTRTPAMLTFLFRLILQTIVYTFSIEYS